MKPSLSTKSPAILSVAVLLTLHGCASDVTRFPPSTGHISDKPKAEAAANIPAPVQVPLQLPPPKAQAKPLTYNVVVTEVPAKELLFSLARDTKLNIDVHPNIQGVVTLNAINETLPAILDRIAHQVNIRYKLEGNTLIVTPDTPFLKTYHVDYVNITRKTTSSIGVSAQVATTGTSPGAGGAASSGASNSSSTTVTSTSNNEFWETLTVTLRDLLNSTRLSLLTKDEIAERKETESKKRVDCAKLSVGAGVGAPGVAAICLGETDKQLSSGQEKKDDVFVNPVAGSITIMARETQHNLVQQYLEGIQTAANRQVLIEATIVEVTLKDQFRAGIDWTRLVELGATTGFSFAPATNLAGSLTSFQTLTYQNASGNFRAAIKVLDSFGEARVLSSPKLLVLNNQTSILKAVDNLVYFSVQVTPGTTTNGVTTAAVYSTTANTVPVGVIMSVTPQINEAGRVTLVVRPTISRKSGDVPDPNPDLAREGVTNNVPVIQVREMESVLQVTSGDTAILGGLMQDDVSKNRDGLPGLTDNPITNILFGTRDRNATQTELVIFLRPTVITNPSLSSDELSFYKRFLPQAPANGQGDSRSGK